MTQPTYIPLRVHTEFSITDGMVRIKKLVSKAAEYGLPALGVSDLMNEFGLVKFYKACRGAASSRSAVRTYGLRIPTRRKSRSARC